MGAMGYAGDGLGAIGGAVGPGMVRMLLSSDTESSGVNEWFSVPAFFILLRETIEAALIISVLLGFLRKAGAREREREVWLGAGAGVLASILFGLIFIVAYYAAKEELFTGNAAYIFEAIMSFLACIMVTFVGAMMIKLAQLKEKFEEKLGEQVDIALAGKNKYALHVLTFTAVFREGIESTVFLAGVGVRTAPQAIPIAGICGVLVGVMLGYLLFFTSLKIDIVPLLWGAACFLFFIGAGLASYAIHEVQETEALGNYEEEPKAWGNVPVYDASGCCSDKENEFWALMRAIFGYQDKPTPLEFIFYFGYFVFAAVGLHFYLQKISAERSSYKELNDGEEDALRMEEGGAAVDKIEEVKQDSDGKLDDQA